MYSTRKKRNERLFFSFRLYNNVEIILGVVVGGVFFCQVIFFKCPRRRRRQRQLYKTEIIDLRAEGRTTRERKNVHRARE